MKNRTDTSALPGRMAKKTELIRFLNDFELGLALKWLENQRRPISLVSSLLFTTDQTLRWRAIELLGRIAGVISKRDKDSIRKLLTHNFWMMNDESGNVGWYAPETIGEILNNVPGFIDEFGIMLPTYINEEPFEKGTHWAIARLSESRPEIFIKDFTKILRSLDNSDPYIRVYTAKAVMFIDSINAKTKVEKLTVDQGEVELYDFTTGNLFQTSVGKIVTDLVNI